MNTVEEARVELSRRKRSSVERTSWSLNQLHCGNEQLKRFELLLVKATGQQVNPLLQKGYNSKRFVRMQHAREYSPLNNVHSRTP
jgi:hypothetical protein